MLTTAYPHHAFIARGKQTDVLRCGSKHQALLERSPAVVVMEVSERAGGSIACVSCPPLGGRKHRAGVCARR